MAAEQGKLNDEVHEPTPRADYETTPYPQRATNLDRESEGEGAGSERSARIKEEIDRTRARMDETVNAIESRMKPRHLLDEVLGMMNTPTGREKAAHLKEAAAEKGTRLVETVKQNPVPALLIGAGVAWLLLGGIGVAAGAATAAASSTGRTHGPRRHPRPNARYADDPTSDEWYDWYEGSTGMDADLSTEQRRSRRGVVETAREKLSHAAETLRHKAHDAAEAVRSHLPGDHESSMGGESHRYRNSMMAAPSRVMGNTREFVSDQPLAAGAAALAAGLALALLLPATRTEEQFVGEGADQLRRRVKDAGSDLLERGKHVARSAASAAMDAAEREGLTPEAAREKAGTVVAEAKNAAMETAQAEGLTGSASTGRTKAAGSTAAPLTGQANTAPLRPASDPSV